MTEHYMAIDNSPPPTTSEEDFLDRDPLNGGLALIKAFVERTAKDCGFGDIEAHHVPFRPGDYGNLDLTISFNVNAKGCRNAKAQRETKALEKFEEAILAVTDRISKNLVKGHEKESYTVPLNRSTVPQIAHNIQKHLAPRMPTSSFLRYLNNG